ncbi:MAG: hypothetical protein HY892_11535 [Deltaproteobacteria bacterium]|nr:hypothetical protein [Deltaproteobacteria bacterium]
MTYKRKNLVLLLTCLLLLTYLVQGLEGAVLQQFEGRITQINEQKGNITVNELILDASDFELGDLQIGYWVMGDFIKENDKLRLVDLEVIK